MHAHKRSGCVQVGLKRGIIELESAIGISLYRVAALYADPEHARGYLSLSLRSRPLHPSQFPVCLGDRDRRAERGDGLELGRTWSVFRVFRGINPLMLSMYTRRRRWRSPATPVNAYTHGISIIWIVKVFADANCSLRIYAAHPRLGPTTQDDNARLSLKADFTHGKYRRNAHSSREFKLECNSSN